MEKSLYEFRDYKLYLTDRLKSEKNKRSGQKSALAKTVGCHTAYLSQVLNGDAHFSLEQSEKVNSFFSHTESQSHFFLLLVQLARAGSVTLRRYFQDQIDRTVEKQFDLKDRLNVKNILSRENQSIYYNSWLCAAIHVVISLPQLKTMDDIAMYLGVSKEKVSETLEFLISVGLVVKNGTRYEIGNSSLHLDKSSPMISKHHTNWRLQAIQSLDRVYRSDLHYSSVITASKADSVKIREIMVNAIEEIRSVVKASKDEDGFCYAFDFFELGR